MRRGRLEIINYLPELGNERLYDLILTECWSELNRNISDIHYERVGIDRLLSIVVDIQNRFGKNGGFNILDVGCNNGLFSVGMAAFGNHIVGIDNYAINTQKKYDELRFDETQRKRNFTLINQDISDFLKEQKNNDWDFALLLSVAHQWEYGYAHSGEHKFLDDEIHKIFNAIMKKTKLAVYYECPFDEPGFEIGYGMKFLEKYLDDLHEFGINLIEETVGPNGYPRQLYRIERRL